MIAYLAEIYEGELLSSCLCRTFRHDGYLTSTSFGNILFNGRKESIVQILINSYKDDVRDAIKQTVGLKEVVQNHTLIPYYLITINNEDKKAIYRKCLKFKGNITKYLPIPKKGSVERLRYCPMCMNEEVKNNGDPYIHTIHQVVDYCPKHGCRTVKTNIVNHKIGVRSFETLGTELIKGDVDTLPLDDIRIAYSRYVQDILMQQISFDAIKVSEFLRSRLGDKYYLGKRFEKVNSLRLFNDMKDFYKGLPSFNLTKYRIASMFNSTQINVEAYLLICFFLKITPKDAVRRNAPKISKTDSVNSKILGLYKEFKSINKVSQMLDIDKRTIRLVVRQKGENKND